MRLYRKLIRPMHSYPGSDYSPRVMPIEPEVKWYPEEERERLEKKYAYYNEGSFSDLVFEEKYEPYLLKEQEAVEPTLIREGRNKYYNDYVCSRCDNEVVYEQNYCSECGVRFLWEGR